MVIDGESPTIVTGGGNGGYGNGFGFGDSWIALILFAMIFGGGNWGWGGNGSGANSNYVLASDFATLQRQLDSATNSIERKGDYIQEQICNSDQMNSTLFATVNSNLSNGFANVAQGFDAVNQNIASNKYENTIATLNAQNALTSQIANATCQGRYDNLVNTNTLANGLSDIRYGMAQDTCGLRNTINNTTRDIIDNANANFNALRAEIIADRMEAKDAKIQELTQDLAQANLSASQARQNNYLVNALRPTPVPAFSVPAPWYNGNYGCGMAV